MDTARIKRRERDEDLGNFEVSVQKKKIRKESRKQRRRKMMKKQKGGF